MKRLIAVLSGLLVLPAFAEVAPIYYDDTIEYSDMEMGNADDAIVEENVEEQVSPKPVLPAVTSPRNTTGRTVSRAVAASGAQSVAPTRTVTSRGTTTRNASTARTTVNTGASRAASARATVSRASVTTQPTATSGATVTPRRATSNTTTARSGTTARAAANSSIVQTDTVNQPLYTGRVGVRTSGVTSRVPTIRMAGTSTTDTSATSTSTATTTTDMDELAQVTDFCKAQYTQCMDNFCNVLDDNQGRCSCSVNLKNYANTENALKKATEDLQDVAQKIQYIGLTGDEIETLFTQTEAELKMQNASDSSQLKNDLDRIKNLIVDVKSGNASSTDTGLSLDLSGLLDFSISSTGFDLSSMFGTTANTSSISNQRGEQLYKTATARCKASVLNTCAAQGVDISLITNSYDLEIDKQCIQYERSLTETNTQMASTVRNAKSVLQKARLMVAQQKNAYDLRGCINALDTCMQDEFVCGSDYENCLDPTGKWIVNGEVVVGSTPGVSGGTYKTTDKDSANAGQAVSGTLYTVWDYTSDKTSKNVWSNGSVNEYVSAIADGKPGSTTTDMRDYLRTKIGYSEKGKNYGMCVSVLNKCQDLTYSNTNAKDKTFKYDNDVIKEYLQRTLIQIKAQQDKVLAEYADSCVSDVASCLSQNNYNYSGKSNANSPYSDVAINACMPIIKTCQNATTHPDNASSVYDWLNTALGIQHTTTLVIGGTKIDVDVAGKDSTNNNAAIFIANDKNISTLADTTKYALIKTTNNQPLIIDKTLSSSTISKTLADTIKDDDLTNIGLKKVCSGATCQISKKAAE